MTSATEMDIQKLAQLNIMAEFAADMLLLYINGTNKDAIDSIIGTRVKIKGPGIDTDERDFNVQSMMLHGPLLDAAKDWMKRRDQILGIGEEG